MTTAEKRKPKQYPLDVKPQTEIDYGWVTCYYSKGWHAAADFVQAAKRSGAVLSEGAECEVKQVWWRCNPDTYYGAIYADAEGPGRGNFPVTVLEGYFDATPYDDAWRKYEEARQSDNG